MALMLEDYVDPYRAHEDVEPTPISPALRLGVYIVLAFFIAMFWLAAIASVQAVRHGRPTPPPPAAPSSRRPSANLSVYAPSGDEMIRWDAADRRLIVRRDHLPSDALLCLGDECDLVVAWKR